jgi:hypothetical protein
MMVTVIVLGCGATLQRIYAACTKEFGWVRELIVDSVMVCVLVQMVNLILLDYQKVIALQNGVELEFN